jgi:hypothetical protein
MEVEDILPNIKDFANVIKNEDPQQIVSILNQTPLWIFSSLFEMYLSPPARMQLLVSHDMFCHYKKAICTPFCTLPWQTGRLSFRFEAPSQQNCNCYHETQIQTLYEGKWYLIDDEMRAMKNDNHNRVEITWDDIENGFEVCTVIVLY